MREIRKNAQQHLLVAAFRERLPQLERMIWQHVVIALAIQNQYRHAHAASECEGITFRVLAKPRKLIG